MYHMDGGPVHNHRDQSGKKCPYSGKKNTALCRLEEKKMACVPYLAHCLLMRSLKSLVQCAVSCV